MSETPAPSPEAVAAAARPGMAPVNRADRPTDLIAEARSVIEWAGADSWVGEVIGDLLPLLTPASPEDQADECEMFHEPPMDFAYCKTHDDTFPLGGACKFQGREVWEVYAEEADEQRGLKVRAEMELDRLRAAVAEEIAQAIEASARYWPSADSIIRSRHYAAVARAAGRRGGETDGR